MKSKKIALITISACALFLAKTSPITAQCNVSNTITTFPHTESFESNFGDWTNPTGDDGDWRREYGYTYTNYTGPSTASDGTYYAYVESSDGSTPGNPNKTAFLDSPCYDLSGATSPVITFDYHMYGSTMGTLKVQISTNGGTTYSDIGWSKTGQQHTAYSSSWTSAYIDLSAYIGQTVKLRFYGETGTSYTSDMAIDNVSVYKSTVTECAVPITAFPYNEDFETGLGDWSNPAAIDDGDWTHNSGTTPTSTTGPSSASNGTFYMYTESSSGESPGFPNKTAYLDSPCFDLSSASSPYLTFDYHMYGSDMGTLKIQVSTDNGLTYSDIGWSKSGQQQTSNGAAWTTAQVDLIAYAGQTIRIRIHGQTASSQTSDMAIDNVTVYKTVLIPCATTITSFPYSEDFETGLGDWINQSIVDDGDWTRNNGTTPTASTGPSSASNGTFYMYTESSNSGGGLGYPNKKAYLDSPCFDLTTATLPYLTFDYHMYGSTTGTLKVQVSVDSGITYSNIGWSEASQRHASSGASWTEAQIDLSSYIGQTIRLRIFGKTALGETSDMAIDNVKVYSIAMGTCTTTITSFPHTEDFESGTGDWTNATSGDDGDWTRNSGNTPTSTTGPSSASNGSFYMYTESSSGASPGFPDKTAYLDSPCYDLTGATSPYLTFDYHMYGSDMGELKVQVSTNNGFFYTDTGWTKTGQQQTSNGAAWKKGAVDLTAYIGQTIKIRIHGKTASSQTSDMAVDNITMYKNASGSCSTTTSTFPYSEGFESGLGIWTQVATDDYDWTRTNAATPTPDTGPSAAAEGSYYMHVEATDCNAGDVLILESDCFDLSSLTSPEFTMSYHMYGSTIGNLKLQVSTNSGFSFKDINNTLQVGYKHVSTTDPWKVMKTDLTDYKGNTVKLRIVADKGTQSSQWYGDIAIDDIEIKEGIVLTNGPGGVTNNLALWFKGNGSSPLSDGDKVYTWKTDGRGVDATPHIPQQAPTYKDNATDNINFNPVIDFDNNSSTITYDNYYTYNNPNTQFLEGSEGFYSQEIFMVLMPDQEIKSSTVSMYVFSGDENINVNEIDFTGITLGETTVRFNNEIISFLIGESDYVIKDSYGVADNNSGNVYDNAGLINARNTISGLQQELYYNAVSIENDQNDIPDFSHVNNSRFWIGRGESTNATTDARIAEIITYSKRVNDATLTSDRNKIQSYLALKYGITLGANGVSQDYVDSDANVFWDQSSNIGYNFDIAGIGRDDNSNLYQKQSKSINSLVDGTGETRGLLTFGLTDIYDTNNVNLSTNSGNTIANQNFLMWGNNNGNLDATPDIVSLDLSSGITGLTTNVECRLMRRIWKVNEVGSISTTKVSIPKNALRSIPDAGDGDYLMFISDSPTFTASTFYKILDTDTSGDNLYTTYDFDNTKYITFAYSPKTILKRSIQFNGTSQYLDMKDILDLNPSGSGFTVSAWVRRAPSANNMSIFSKRDASFTNGYDFKINASNKIEMSWGASGTNSIFSNTSIPENKWHHAAVIYNASTNQASLYIDGVLDKTSTLPAPPTTTHKFRIAAAGEGTVNSFFEGNIDEVRVWNTALSVDQLRYVMNQEIMEDTAKASGKILPASVTKNEIKVINWSELAGYYPLDTYTFPHIHDESSNLNKGILRNINTVDYQSAPLPYESGAAGNWDDAATWKYGTMLDLPGNTSLVDPSITLDWNIVRTSHDVTMNNSTLPVTKNKHRKLLGLHVENGTLNLPGTTDVSGNALTTTHYLKIDGKLDLNGESQLIQTTGSDLDVTSSGTLERDQQGTSNAYTYNYWSSPVGISNTTTNNNSYSVSNIFSDGTNVNSPQSINFISSSYNGSHTSPIGISDYWIWKYANNNNSYSQWQQVKGSGSINAGEGFTMKGYSTTEAISTLQNYIIEGKPNNGDITLPITANYSYLVGNPYPSALDANDFINDNTNTSGTLYFWQHWGGGSHYLEEYQGGYATYNLSGGLAGVSHGMVSATGSGTITPSRYIPVAQGFFVKGNSTGTITFNNSQRDYQHEDTVNSAFVRLAGNSNQKTDVKDLDTRTKIKLLFESPKTFKAQLLLTQDENASLNIDWGYDGRKRGSHKENMYWMLDDNKYVIQGIGAIEPSVVLPIGLHTELDGLSTISIYNLKNVDRNTEIYLHDKVTDVYHDLRLSAFNIYLNAGEYLDRFELTFNNEITLDNNNSVLKTINTYFNNHNKSIIVNNPELKTIDSVKLFNVVGQEVITFNTISDKKFIQLKTPKLGSGIYTIKLTSNNQTLAKKVIIK